MSITTLQHFTAADSEQSRALFKRSTALLHAVMSRAGLPHSTVVHAIVDNNCPRCERQKRGESSMLGGDAYRS